MGRPAGITSEMIGLARSGAGRGRPYGAIGKAGLEVEPEMHEVRTPAGLILRTVAAGAIPVSQDFEGIAYLRRLASLRRRAARRLPLFGDGPADGATDHVRRDEGERVEPKVHFGWRSGARKYEISVEDLVTCYCARCRRRLLSESQRPLRLRAERRARSTSVRTRNYAERQLLYLPPLVAAWAGGRPYCLDCLDQPCVAI